MRVRIVSYEDINAWILGKFARKLHEELTKLGIDCDISNAPDKNADINHHIIYLGYDVNNTSKADTLMITHIDDLQKLNLLKRQMTHAELAICMSSSIIPELIKLGVPQEKLCYVNPAHDSVITPEPYTVGITSKVQPDGCKREDMLLTLSEHITPSYFKFKIMGAGWDDIVKRLQSKGFEVIYFPDFDYNEYIKLIRSLDYFLYFGLEQGSMGFMDALSAGVKTIVPPDGYHNDAENGIVHPFVTNEELIEVFKNITAERKKLVDSVATWTWHDYAVKHLELWRHVLNPQNKHKSHYRDGLNSLLRNQSNDSIAPSLKHSPSKFQLFIGGIRKKIYRIRRIKDLNTLVSKLKKYLKNKG